MGIILIAVSAAAQRVVAFGVRLEQLKKTNVVWYFHSLTPPRIWNVVMLAVKSSNVQQTSKCFPHTSSPQRKTLQEWGGNFLLVNTDASKHMCLTISNWSKHSEAFEAIYSSIGHLHNGNTQTVWEELNWVAIFTHQTYLYRFSLYLHRDCFLVKGIVIVCWLQRNRHKKSTFRLLWRLLTWSFLWLCKFLWNFISMSQHME